MPQGDLVKHQWSYMQRAILIWLADHGPVAEARMLAEFRRETLDALVVTGAIGISGPAKRRVYELTKAGKEDLAKWRTTNK